MMMMMAGFLVQADDELGVETDDNGGMMMTVTITTKTNHAPRE
jgi:hypothetical protein